MIISSNGIISISRQGLLIIFLKTRVGFSLFFVVYGNNPHAPLDLAHYSNLKWVDNKAEDLIA